MRKNKQGGFTLIESIIVIVLAVGVVFVAYHFGWGARSEAGEKRLGTDVRTIEQAVGAYILKSNGLYPTDDGKRPQYEHPKFIMWDASFTAGNKTYAFHPDFIKRNPRHWNEGIWRVDRMARVSVDINPKEY